MNYLIIIFWFFSVFKNALFYLYLWQLKEYQFYRFLDHFRTEKGKRLIFNKIIILKIFILFFFLLFIPFQKTIVIKGFLLFFLQSILLFIYFAEFFIFLFKIFQKKLKKPVLTKKAILLISLSVFFIFLICAYSIFLKNILYFGVYLLIFDILSPIIFSLIVLILEPFSILLRKKIMRKAEEKISNFKELITIGITGSFGKTSTKEFLSTILSEKFNVLKTKEHQNSEMGISNCILNELNLNHQVFIAEMGAYRKGGIKMLANIIKPKIGIITGVNEQHLATFGSIENLLSAEGGKELIESLPSDGLVIFNGDNKYLKDLYKETFILKRIYSVNKLDLEKSGIEPDFWAEDIKVEKRFIHFTVKNKNNEIEHFTINILGAHNVSNILAAITTAYDFGMSLKEISQACLKIKPEQGSIHLFETKSGLNILDSSYSANPDGVIADLNYLSIYPRKKIIIMPCLIELGKVSKEIHQKIGRKIGEVCDLSIITTKDRYEDIKKGAIESGMKEENIIFDENTDTILKRIKNFVSVGDVVLIEGRVSKELVERLKSL
ncbi:MAG TPA: UDP-N-acetylmuramoyl-tripeptide--D-alanyl-D-alanine ligase [Candidatus Pacearchaeota archaeon]|nr:UDP-N-acetylmuramoyl-tripeptide--D-alanyl-D-alanine ligase [Candidatus Pacearchaeota archaeon]